MRDAQREVMTLFLGSAHRAPDRVQRREESIHAAITVGGERSVYLAFLPAAPGATVTFARGRFQIGQHFRSTGVPRTFPPVPHEESWT